MQDPLLHVKPLDLLANVEFARGPFATYTLRVPKKHKNKPLPAEVREIFARYGSEGGKIGGKMRWKGTTPEERSAVARKAAQARWNKAKGS